MSNDRISVGKRPKNPLRRRVFKDMRRDWKRYLLICVLFVVTIGFVSGMYVGNNSMLASLDSGVERFRREDGHFELSRKADADTLSAIASGEKADVTAVLRERAYEEAEEKVAEEAEKQLKEEVKNGVLEAIRTQVEAGVDEQLKAAEAMGMTVSDEERSKSVDEAYDKAVSENYDSAYKEAYDTALKSDEYKNAVSDALSEAKKEIDKEIDEKYNEIADRYSLNEDSKPVPVDIYELFYKDVSEKLPADSDYKGKVRIYNERTDVDLYDIIKGRAPETDSEILIDRMHADNADIKIGDTLTAGGQDFTVVGYAAFVDYTTLYEKNTDTMFDALTFDVAMTTDGGFERVKSGIHANYAYQYKNKPADKYEEKEMSDSFLKALITQVAVSDTEDLEIEDYLPSYANQALIFASNDMGKDKSMGAVLLYILTAVLAFIFAVSISTSLESESSVIGTLRASGYTKGELLVYYMSAPLIVVLISAVIGNVLGYTLFKNIILAMYYESYSLPNYETLWTPEAFLRTTVVPIVMMMIINFVVIIRTLGISPLRLLRHDLKRKKNKKALKLPDISFFHRFRIRVFLQNIPNYLMLVTGIVFVMLLLSMGVGLPATLDYYKGNLGDMMFAKEEVILTSTKDDDGNEIKTSVKDAEKFSVTSLERKSETYDEEVSVYGFEPDSKYIMLSKDFCGKLTDSGTDEVYISQAYADKYGVVTGDTIELSEKYEHKVYKWKVYDIYDYSAGIAVFMTNDMFNAEFEKDEGSFSGYVADKALSDIDSKYIAKEITVDDVMKLANQLDHSMGAYMLYFQYVCVIVAAIILYLLTKIIIEKNEHAISMSKILGYSNGEIASLYLIPTAIVVFCSEFIAMYLGDLMMKWFWKMIMMTLSGWFAYVMPVSGFVKEFVLVFIAYLAITVLDFIRIRRIPKVLALKNME